MVTGDIENGRREVSRDFVGALLQLNAEKGVSREQLIRTVEEAIQSAYRRSPGDEDIHVRIDGESGKVRVFRARLVVEEIDDPTIQFTVAVAHAYHPGAEVGAGRQVQITADAQGPPLVRRRAGHDGARSVHENPFPYEEDRGCYRVWGNTSATRPVPSR